MYLRSRSCADVCRWSACPLILLPSKNLYAYRYLLDHVKRGNASSKDTRCAGRLQVGGFSLPDYRHQCNKWTGKTSAGSTTCEQLFERCYNRGRCTKRQRPRQLRCTSSITLLSAHLPLYNFALLHCTMLTPHSSCHGPPKTSPSSKNTAQRTRSTPQPPSVTSGTSSCSQTLASADSHLQWLEVKHKEKSPRIS